MPKSLYVSRVAHHYWEEPVISGKKGTVAVFFTGCTLDCIYCQNREISHSNLGRKVTIDELAKEVTLLLDKGAESLSFITPSHYTNGIIQLLDIISPKVPVVYNTSGFDSIETLKKLEGYIDIYLPDFKYSNNDLGLEYSNVRNYFDVTSKAIEEMVRQTGEPVINQDGIMEKGTMVRNLVLPSHTKNSIEVINYLAEKYGDKILFSLMGQYIPYGDAKNHKPGRPSRSPQRTRRASGCCRRGSAPRARLRTRPYQALTMTAVLPTRSMVASRPSTRVSRSNRS